MKTKALTANQRAIILLSVSGILATSSLYVLGNTLTSRAYAQSQRGVKPAQRFDAVTQVKNANEPQRDRFETDIRGFEKDDATNPPSPGGTVFVGSSTFRFWKSLEDEFKEFHAINRGFGGSTFPDINNYIERIVTKYKPSKVVVYAGTNDIAELKHSAEAIFHDYQEFVKQVQAKCPNAEIYFISMSMAPSRTQWSAVYDKGNELIRTYSKSTKHLHYIDVLPVMKNKKGETRKDLFGQDNLHMNLNGYALWTPIVSKALKEIN